VEYPIANVHKDGGFRTSKALVKFLKEGRFDLLTNSDYLFNKETGRVVSKGVYFNRFGKMRPKFVREGWALDDDVPTLIEKPVAWNFEKVFQGKTFADKTYALGAEGYKRPKTTEQDRISRDVEAKIKLMKELGRVEIDGTPSEMLAALKQIDRPHVSYITDEGKYRAGGFMRRADEKDQYIVLAQPMKKLSFSVDLKQVRALYAQAYKYKIEPLVATTEKPTKFPVTINGIVVKYCVDGSKRTRYMSTGIFKATQEHYKD